MMKNVTTTIIGVVVLAAGSVFAATSYRAFVSPGSDEAAGAAPVLTVETAPALAERVVAASSTTPVRLVIPSIGVDAKVKSVGLTKEGDIATPGNFTDVAWYKYGPAPGRPGSAVMNGHLDNGLGLAGVFSRLKDLKEGDDVIVNDAAGQRLAFRVSAVRTYGLGEPAPEVFLSGAGPRLSLVTCDGVWNKAKKSYSERLVVFAEYVGS